VKRPYIVCAALSAIALCVPAAAEADRTVFVTGSQNQSTGLAAFSATGGPLVPLPGTPVATGESTHAVHVSPDARSVYVANALDDTLTAYSIGATGVPTKIADAATGNEPTGIATSPDGDFLLAGNRDGDGAAPSISVFSVAANGALAPVGVPVNPGVFGPRGIVFTPDGNFVYVIGRRGPQGGGAGSADTAIATMTLSDSGVLAPVAGSPTFINGQVAGFGLSVSPDGKHLYAAHSNNFRIYGFDINGATGALSGIAGSPFTTTGQSPQELSVTPDGKSLYVAEVFGQKVEGFNINAATGALTQIPGTPVTVAGQSDALAITPDGNSLYQSILSDPGQVEGFAINPINGGLSRFTGSPYASGTTFPSFFSVAITPTQTPVPSFTVPATPKSGQAIAFNASGTTVRGGEATKFSWDFGDGSTVSNGSPTISHAYAADGTYTVKLTVRNDCDPSAVFTGTVATIGNAVYCNGAPTASTTRKLTLDSVLQGTATAKPRQKQKGKKVKVQVKVAAGEQLTVALAGKVKVGKVRARLAPKSVSVGAGTTRKLKLKPAKKASSKKILEALAKGKKPKAKVKGTLTDAAGNAANLKFEVELKG